MLKISFPCVSGLGTAIHGMRHAYKSIDKSDSEYDDADGLIKLGEKDEKLAKILLSGSDHRKYLRFIHVSADIQAPLYWWKEMDQYKVGTVTNSESTMHTITADPLTLDDFAFDSMVLKDGEFYHPYMDMFEDIIQALNDAREEYLFPINPEQKKRAWRFIIQTLPESYLQTRCWDGNYEVLRRIYKAREGHKLTEWQEFRDWIKTLPYSELITD